MSVVDPEENVDKYLKKEEYRGLDEEQAEFDHLAPSRWWFSSTLFPLIAGTFGPMASMFNICALVVDWRVSDIVEYSSTSNEAVGQFVSDPHWVVAVNAVSLIIAIIANLALLAKNFGRLPFSVASAVTSIGWYISSFLLIGLVAAAPSHLPLPADEERTFSQAYYYAILASAIYFLVASLVVCTSTGVYLGKYTFDIKLTFSQSTLMFQVILFLGYVLAAAAVYARIEDWDYLDGVYWVTVTLFTIGFGDFSPKTHLGRGLFFPMAIGGILFVGLIVASISTLVLDRGSTKVSIRMVEKARQKALKNYDPQTNTIRRHPLRKQNLANDPSSELSRREQEFNLMRQVQQTAGTYNRTIALAFSLIMLVFLWFIGAVCFWQAEKDAQNWSYFESLYFTYVSLLTIGYGDFYPQDNSAKPVFVLWALIALPTLTVLIGSIGGVINEGVNTITLWLGDHLPEQGALSAVKGEASKVKGDAFKQAKPPGFMEDGKSESAGTEDSAHAEAVRGMAHSMHEGQGAEGGQTAAGKHLRHYLLMKEMQNVVKHLDATPPRKYSFKEWTWFLKLLGEDESNPRTHRRIADVQDAAVNDQNSASIQQPGDANGRSGEGEERRTWSWLGVKSPLITANDEPKWVLERLMKALERELGDQERRNAGLGEENGGRKSMEARRQG